MNNPLIDIPFEIPFDQVHAVHVEPAVDLLLDRAQAAITSIAEQHASLTYESSFGALERALEPLEKVMNVIGHLEAVATTAELREVFNRVQPKVSAFYASIPTHEGLYRALLSYGAGREAQDLDATRKRFVDKTLDDFRRHGAALEPKGKEQLQSLERELAEITTRFSQHALDATHAFELVVTDEARLSGLPESARSAARQSAVAKGLEGWRFTLQAPSVIALLSYADDASLRRSIWQAYHRRAASAPHDNARLISQIVELRQKKARLLGYLDFADLALEERMAKDGRSAHAFVQDLTARTEAAFRRENAELEEFRRELEGPAAGPLCPWDVAYYAEKFRRSRFDFDAEALRPYFAVESVLSGMFRIVEHLYGLRVQQRPASTWNETVRCYGISEGDRFLGAFYVDLYPRENKRDGAWMADLITGMNGEPHLGLFCANVTPPVEGKPTLLTHREVETLFHEFGHLLHHVLSDVSVRSLAGTRVAWDFVELPSQIMENWCWEREALDLFARHHETHAPIPDDLFDKMKRARAFRSANAMMRQLGFAALDLALHRQYDPSRDGDIVAYAREVLQRFSPVPLPADYSMITSFGHLFGSPVGYAAGYYSYKWAEVLEADAFGRFQEEGVLSPSVGGEFRRHILSQGDSRDPAELYEDFRGRPPKLEALLKRCGL